VLNGNRLVPSFRQKDVPTVTLVKLDRLMSLLLMISLGEGKGIRVPKRRLSPAPLSSRDPPGGSRLAKA